MSKMKTCFTLKTILVREYSYCYREHDIEEILNMNVKLRSSEMQPNRTVRISKLSLFQAFKRAENIVLSKVTNSSSNGEMNSI